MREQGFEPDAELANVYIRGFASSKAIAMHNLCWEMFKSEKAK
jgi:hypothetical protein